MATLILTAVGSAVGGPIGGALGAIAGQALDQSIFAPPARQGPRLADLTVQTSRYGSAIPRLFGRTRVSGTVVWSTDLIETTKRQANGKGRAATDTYSYSASFAVLLSARPIVDVARIWADGKLLRGAAADLKVPGLFRLHAGDADASPDPLIAAAEGADACAWRGSAYAVFEGLQLGDYGNRIPSLSFEVIAEAAPVAIGDVLHELTGATCDAGETVAGFAASGDSVRGVARMIAAAYPFSCRDEDAGRALRFTPVEAGALDATLLGARVGEGTAPRIAFDIDPLDRAPVAITIAYADDARDYQAGLQRARREGPGARDRHIDLPATLAAADARALVERALARIAAERTRATVTLPWSAMMLRPGDAVTVAGDRWRVTEFRLEAMVVQLSLVRIGTIPTGAAIVEPGRIVAEPDAPHGPTTLMLVDLPPLSDVAATRPSVAVFAAGVSPGWRRAQLLASIDLGATFELAGATALPATMGTTASALPVAAPDLIDRVGTVEVTLLNTAMALFDADTERLLAGANRAMIGDELIQFGRAALLAPGRYRLSALWRGRRGTDAAIVAHPPGSRFVLLDLDTAALLPPELAVAGVRVMAAGVGDADPYPEAACPTATRSITPLAPAALTAALLASGDTVLSWVRRSREGWAWRDGLDAPIGEEREHYRIVRTVGATVVTDEVDSPMFTYSAAARAADRARGATAAVFAVVQVGAHAVSAPIGLTLPL